MKKNPWLPGKLFINFHFREQENYIVQQRGVYEVLGAARLLKFIGKSDPKQWKNQQFYVHVLKFLYVLQI